MIVLRYNQVCSASVKFSYIKYTRKCVIIHNSFLFYLQLKAIETKILTAEFKVSSQEDSAVKSECVVLLWFVTDPLNMTKPLI